MKFLTGNELLVRLREANGFRANNETLHYAAAQNVIPDTLEAVQDLIYELSRVGVQPATNFKRYRMYPICSSNPDDKLATIYRCAESAYLRMIPAWSLLKFTNIYRIDHIENKNHSDAFYATKQRFLQQGINAEERFMFHGTNDHNIDLILQNNFDANYNPTHKPKGSALGQGIYFSEFPYFASQHGTLILCRVLPSRVQDLTFTTSFTQNIQDQFDSRKITSPQSYPDHSHIHAVKNPEQIIPYCIIILQSAAVAKRPKAKMPTTSKKAKVTKAKKTKAAAAKKHKAKKKAKAAKANK